MTVGKLPPVRSITDERNAAVKRVSAWNKANRVGAAIAVRILKHGPEYRTTTRSIAWVSGTTAFIMIEGRAGGWDLGFVRALETGERLPPLPPKGQVAPSDKAPTSDGGPRGAA